MTARAKNNVRICGGLKGGDGGGFGYGCRLLFGLPGVLEGRGRFLLHDALDEFGYCAFSFCCLGDFGARGHDA